MLTAAKGANLLVMFLLELGVLASVGYWGWTLDANLAVRLLAAIGGVALFVGVWAIFGAANDAKIPLRGYGRALLEILWFGGAPAALAAAGRTSLAAVFAAIYLINAALRLYWKQVLIMGKHVVAGAGQVGSLVARQLIEQGHEVVVISRSGSGPNGARREAADVADRDTLINLTKGADVLYNCVNPPYHRWQQDWPAMADALLATADATGAVYAILGNLYVYGPPDGPMIESDPLNPSSAKAQVRVNMWQQALAAHEAGRARVTEVRGSDYFGPGCRDQSHVGERFVPRMLAGKPARFVVNTSTPHSWSYVPDVATTMVVAATDERAWGRAWHVPTNQALSVHELADRLCAVAGLPNPGVTSMPTWLVRALGTVSPMLGEIEAIRYQFDKPFVIDSSDFETTFGIAPTPMDDALEATVEWWRDLDRTHV